MEENARLIRLNKQLMETNEFLMEQVRMKDRQIESLWTKFYGTAPATERTNWKIYK